MSKVLVVYYSMYGHVETMAGAIAQGAREIPDTWQPVGLRMFYCGGGRSVHFSDRFR